MKKLKQLILVVVVAVSICSNSYGQALNEKTLIGKWSVTKVTSPMDKFNLPDSDMKGIIAMKKVFHNAILEFKENGKFFIKFPKKDSISSAFLKLNGKNWKYDFRDEFITILDNDKEESEMMSFSVPAFTPISDVKFSVYGMIILHMKKGEISTKIDYDKIVVKNKTNEKSEEEKSVEEKSKETYGEDLYQLKKANEAKDAISYDDINVIDGIAYFKDSNALVYSGKIEERYDNGNLKMEGWFLDGKKNEVWTWYYKNGQVLKEKTYLNGKLEGVSKEWNENGQLTRTTNYKDGIKVVD